MEWSTVVNAACTVVALLVALFLGLRSMRLAEANLKVTADSLRQNNLSAIYTLSQESTKFFEANPKLLKFFDKEYRAQTMTDAELWAEFRALPEDQRVKAYLGCEKLADFMQIAFIQRDVIPDDDWDTWWSFMTDQYDESPILRDHLANRVRWYAFHNEIKPWNRDKFFRGYQKKGR